MMIVIILDYDSFIDSYASLVWKAWFKFER